MDTHQQGLQKDLEEEVQNACRDALQSTLLCAQRLSDEEEVMEIDPARTETVEYEGSTPNVQISVTVQVAADDDVVMIDQQTQPPVEPAGRPPSHR